MARVSADFFQTLGVQLLYGRFFLPEEDREGSDRVAIISDSLWRRRFQADPAIIGRSIGIDNAAHAVIGILPADFRFPEASVLDSGPVASEKPEVFKPIAFSQNELKELMGTFNYNVIARLKDSVTPEAAQSELNVIAAQLEKTAGEKVGLKSSVRPLQQVLVGRSRLGLIVLFCAVGAVLLIACVNLANVMLARAERRSREWALRMALGASRRRIVRQILCETLLIALIGGVLGVLFAAGVLGMLLRHAPSDVARLDEVHVDMTVLFFALAVTAATGLLFGGVPAWRCTRSDPQSMLRAGSRGLAGSREGRKFRNALVSAQVGLSAALLVLAALLGGSFLRVMRTDKGFRAPSVLAADVAISMTRYKEPEQRNRFWEQVLDRLGSQPGVVSGAISTALPLTGETWVDSAYVPGDPRPQVERPVVNVRFVSNDYLRTMGIPLLAGRSFNEGDRKRNVVILSERIADQLWPGQNPIGRQMARGGNQNYEVVGVCGDVRSDPDKPAAAIVYRPYWDWAPRHVQLVSRAAGDPRAIAAAIRSVVRTVDPDVPVPEMHTMRDILDDSVAERRFQALLTAAFGAAALLLAALGIYGVVAYTVARRTNELGVRMALGALPLRLRSMVLRQAMTPVVIGLVLGLSAAFAAGRVVASLLYEVNPSDPLTFAAVALVLSAVSLAASWLPAQRAVKVDPIESLRCE